MYQEVLGLLMHVSYSIEGLRRYICGVCCFGNVELETLAMVKPVLIVIYDLKFIGNGKKENTSPFPSVL